MMKQSLSIINTESVTKRLNGDTFLIDALYRIYPKQIRTYMQDIEESLQNENFCQIAANSHSLKSCFLAVGAELCEDTNQRLLNAIRTEKLENVPHLVKNLKNEMEKLFILINKGQS
jgi:HPt (histidine-containing phosphotransfer) domain-containing protein